MGEWIEAAIRGIRLARGCEAVGCVRIGVGKRLVDGRGNGCAMFELSDSRADVRLWAAQGRVALRYATLKREANGLSPAPVGSCAQIVPKLSKAHAPPRARRVEEIGSIRVA